MRWPPNKAWTSNASIQGYRHFEVTDYGGKGEDWASLPTDINQYGSGSGGEGGYSRIRFTMKQNEEYVITGLTTSINTPFIYRKGTLIACVGEGGDAGPASNGGAGGGVVGVVREATGLYGGGARRDRGAVGSVQLEAALDARGELERVARTQLGGQQLQQPLVVRGERDTEAP